MSEEAYLKKILQTELEESLVQYKQMELDSLLEVTKAINMNSSAENLFKIYGFILQAQMKVNRLAVLYKDDGNWTCLHKIDVTTEAEPYIVFDEKWLNFQDSIQLKNTDLEMGKYFDVLMPVTHKNRPLAYVLIGKLQEYMNDSLINRLNFIRTITNIIVVAIENKRLFKKQLEQERLNREMELAAKVQNMLVPNRLPENERFSLDAMYMPHFNIGGDYYDVVEINENELLVCMADVSGKGISAALLMANFQAMLRVLAKDTSLTLEQLVERLNNRVEEITQGERFLTFFVAKYYLKEHKLEYVNAGHPPPILYKENDKEHLQRLDEGTTIIGAFRQLPFIKLGVLEQIPENSMLVLFTDGLTDLVNEQGEFFEEENIIEFVKNQESKTPKEFNKNLLDCIKEFKGQRVFTDDVTVLCWKIV